MLESANGRFMIALKTPRIKRFDFEPGTILARKYEIVSILGTGWEGEVYKLRELGTGIERAAKFFFPNRNLRERAARFYARKLFKLRHCPILVQYHSRETIDFAGFPVTFLISDFVEGELLSHFVARQANKRISVFQGLHLLHSLAAGVSKIHAVNEYHGDLHSNNVILRQRGISFDVKLVDFFYWGPPRAENIRDDVCDLIRLFYDAIGGSKMYGKHPPEVKQICCGLKRSLILRKFRNAGELCHHLETMDWQPV